jgi:hypothetical protein
MYWERTIDIEETILVGKEWTRNCNTLFEKWIGRTKDYTMRTLVDKYEHIVCGLC